ncbi:MAG: glutamine--tRNA ligase/YqeY domain fusion protein [Ardenticatenales bacterium]|nr:glutamine--tRNA ligase/YqeY domain fusion protein [Ardenticatenales bacterium]
MTEETKTPSNFIRTIIDEHNATGRFSGKVHTRFPPEPNGYLHIGHAKSICLNFGLAEDYGGLTNLRFDDTNPTKEDVEYVESIKEDVHWLGFDWDDREFYASDYFQVLYDFAVQLIQQGAAYVDDLSPEEMREYRGTLTEPGKNSPYRDRSIEENLDLLERMKNGEFDEGSRVLRAKIDMASPNINMRDPVLYRIMKAHHHRTGDAWQIYPMYDYAHGLSDMIEGITHSICTLEFEDHRPLYNWFLEELDVPHFPQQIEFARLNMTYTVMSKRKLKRLVDEAVVSGWDDPRMPTISGMRRRGYTPQSIRSFCDRIGVAKANSVIDFGLLEFSVREHLNEIAPRVMAVLDPLKVIIDNYPEGQTEHFEVPNHPQKPEMGNRTVPFSREIYIEREDFMEDAPRKFFRLTQGREVRLMGAYYVTCNEVVKDENGEVIALHCTYDPESRGGSTPDGRKVRGTLHWVSVEHGLPAEVRLYDNLFSQENPEDVPDGEDFFSTLSEDSLSVITAIVEPSLREATAADHYQFMRTGYFTLDGPDSTPDHLVFNRTVGLRDTWAKLQTK